MDEETKRTFIKDKYDFEDLKRIVWQLRAPDGCPWDRKQTHESMRNCMIEETFEVIEAVENRDIPNLREELGDVMLQVLLHSAIAEEQKEFTFEEVVDELAKKLVRRHPHVFGNEDPAKTSEDGLSRWDAIKKKEKEERKQTAQGELARIPHSLPPVMRAYKVIKKAEKIYGHTTSMDGLMEQTKKLEDAENSLTNMIETFIKDIEGLQ